MTENKKTPQEVSREELYLKEILKQTKGINDIMNALIRGLIICLAIRSVFVTIQLIIVLIRG